MNKKFIFVIAIIALLLGAEINTAQASASEPASAVLQVNAINNTKKIKVNFTNNSHGHLTVSVSFTLEHLTADQNFPATFVLAPHATHVITLNKNTSTGAYSYKYKWHYYYGNMQAKPNLTYLYRLPFAKGISSYVCQGYNGNFSHQNINAIDFVLPQGSPIVAARAGVVANVEQDFSEGGVKEELRNKANHIYIEHDDGTVARYAHLQENGARVKPGDKVTEGQLIGYSGNTGYSSRPHLHFEVDHPIDGNSMRTISTLFKINRTSTAIPAKGTTYTAWE